MTIEADKRRIMRYVKALDLLYADRLIDKESASVVKSIIEGRASQAGLEIIFTDGTLKIVREND
jgi:hypothetical protein